MGCVGDYRDKLFDKAQLPGRGFDSPLGNEHSGEREQSRNGVQIRIRPTLSGLSLQRTIDVLSGIQLAAQPPIFHGRGFVEEARIGIAIDDLPAGNADMLRTRETVIQLA